MSKEYDPDFSHVDDLWNAGQAFWGPWYKLNEGLTVHDRHKVLIRIMKLSDPLEGSVEEIQHSLKDYLEEAQYYEMEHNIEFENVLISYSDEYSHYPETQKHWALIGKRYETDEEMKLRIMKYQTEVEEQTKLEAKKKREKEKKERKQYEKLREKYHERYKEQKVKK